MTTPVEAEPLIIRGTICNYPIEPMRFDLGFTRAEMVDQHIRNLMHMHRRHSPDIDVLLDARSMLAGTE